MTKPENTAEVLSPGSKEAYTKVAAKSLSSYLYVRRDKGFLIIKDKDALPDEKLLVDITLSGAQSLGIKADIIEAENDFEETKARELLEKYPSIFNLSSKIHRGSLFRLLSSSSTRLVSPFGATKDLFIPNGAMDEDSATMLHRLKKMETTLSPAVGFDVTTSYGTDLKIALRPFSERAWGIGSGVIAPGTWDNWPGGEIFTTPDEQKVNGTLILLEIDTAEGKHQKADKPIVINVNNGLITSIQGGQTAQQLRKELHNFAQEAIKQNQDPINVYRVAEFGFGANSKALPYRSTVEAEKQLGTVHIAFGSGIHDEERVNGNFDAPCHYDFVIPKSGLTVMMYKQPDEFNTKRMGEPIINEGSLNFG